MLQWAFYFTNLYDMDNTDLLQMFNYSKNKFLVEFFEQNLHSCRYFLIGSYLFMYLVYIYVFCKQPSKL